MFSFIHPCKASHPYRQPSCQRSKPNPQTCSLLSVTSMKHKNCWRVRRNLTQKPWPRLIPLRWNNGKEDSLVCSAFQVSRGSNKVSSVALTPIAVAATFNLILKAKKRTKYALIQIGRPLLIAPLPAWFSTEWNYCRGESKPSCFKHSPMRKTCLC